MTAGRWTLPAVIFICALCWVLTYFLFPDSIASTTPKDSSSFLQSTRDLLLPGWAERIVSFLVYAIIGYFLIELNNQFSIIRMRASMQTAIYFLLVTVCPGMHLLYIGDIVALGSLISIYFLFKSYQQAQAAGYLFYSFFFIGAGSILFPQLTILSVLWLLEAYRFQSLTPRSFCGALLGWMLPYWMLFGHAFFYNEMELFYRPFNQLLAFGEVFNLQILQPWELAILGYLLVMFIVSAVHCIAAGFEDKIRTRAYLQFLIDLTIFLFLLIAIQPNYCNDLLPERFGRKREYALGKTSGKANIRKNLEDLGLELDEDSMRKVTERIIELGDKKELVTQEDLPYIVSDVLKHGVVSEKVKLKSYIVTLAHGLKPMATVRMEINGKEFEENSNGDGQYDAFVRALRKIYKVTLGRKFPMLTNYAVTIPPGGRTDAFVQTVITWSFEDKVFRTRGLDADQTEAAIKATLKMLNIIESEYENID